MLLWSRDPAFCISHFPFQLSAAWSQSPLRVARNHLRIQPQPKCSIHWNIFHVYFLFQIDQKKRDMITGAKTNRFKRNNKRNGKRPNRINKNRQRKMFVLLSRNFIPALFFDRKTKKKDHHLFGFSGCPTNFAGHKCGIKRERMTRAYILNAAADSVVV